MEGEEHGERDDGVCAFHHGDLVEYKQRGFEHSVDHHDHKGDQSGGWVPFMDQYILSFAVKLAEMEYEHWR